MAKSSWSRGLVWAALASALAGCSAVPDSRAPAKPIIDDPLAAAGGSGEPVPRVEPPSRSGNPDNYRVFGRRYRVKETSEGYHEQGIASWYGWDFHGRKTSSGPRYNMFDLTAAHKSLPIPTYVRVTNLDNGRNVVVKVNDRGPFVGRRIIDLSYAAADRLNMVGRGTAPVEVVALEPYQTLPELAARRAEAGERLADRRSRSQPTSGPTTIEFAHEEPVRLAAAELSPRSEPTTDRTENPAPSAGRPAPFRPEPAPNSIETAREEPGRPVAPEPPRAESEIARADIPAPPASRPSQPEAKPEPIPVPVPVQIAREDTIPPETPVVDTPSIRPARATGATRGAARTRSPARPVATPALARPEPRVQKVAATKAPAKNDGREDRPRSPLRLASAETAPKGKAAVESRRPVSAGGGKSGRSEPAMTPTGRRDGRASGERSNDAARRDTRKLSDSTRHQESRAPVREAGAAKSAVRLAGVRASRSRTVTD